MKLDVLWVLVILLWLFVDLAMRNWWLDLDWFFPTDLLMSRVWLSLFFLLVDLLDLILINTFTGLNLLQGSGLLPTSFCISVLPEQTLPPFITQTPITIIYNLRSDRSHILPHNNWGGTQGYLLILHLVVSVLDMVIFLRNGGLFDFWGDIFAVDRRLLLGLVGVDDLRVVRGAEHLLLLLLFGLLLLLYLEVILFVLFILLLLILVCLLILFPVILIIIIRPIFLISFNSIIFFIFSFLLLYLLFIIIFFHISLLPLLLNLSILFTHPHPHFPHHLFLIQLHNFTCTKTDTLHYLWFILLTNVFDFL